MALLFLSFIISFSISAQSYLDNSKLPKIPNSEYAVYKYDSTLQTKILTYYYHNICDLDNDGINDLISFIGNGGAHTYFHLQIKLSSNNKEIVFKTFQIDMPYLTKNTKIEEMTQFLILDYDKDGIDEIYLNIDNPFGSIPKNLKTKGLTSKQMIIEFEKGKLLVSNFKKRRKHNSHYHKN